MDLFYFFFEDNILTHHNYASCICNIFFKYDKPFEDPSSNDDIVNLKQINLKFRRGYLLYYNQGLFTVKSCFPKKSRSNSLNSSAKSSTYHPP